MFHVKLNVREEVKPRIGMYFLYNHEIFKIVKLNENQINKENISFNLVYYDETRGNVISLTEGYSYDFLFSAIISGKYVPIDEGILGDILIPEVMKEY